MKYISIKLLQKKKKKKDLGGDEHSDLYPEWPYVLIGPEMTQFLPVGPMN